MRRKDRELTREEAYKILQKGEYGTLSMIDAEGMPYAVPITYTLKDDCIILHATGAGGMKTDAMLKNPAVCFTAVTDTKVLPAEFGTLYCSAIVRGKAERVEDTEEKKAALFAFLPKYSADYIEQGQRYIEAVVNQVDVWKIHIEELTGKARKK